MQRAMSPYIIALLQTLMYVIEMHNVGNNGRVEEKKFVFHSVSLS